MTSPADGGYRPDRDYLFAALAALLVIFAGMTMRGGPGAGAIAPAAGLLGLFLGWTSMPIVFVILLSYLLIFPFGVPYYPGAINDSVGSHFRIPDLVLVSAALVYLISQYQLFGLTDELLPRDKAAGVSVSLRRPYSAVWPGEFPRVLTTVAGCLVAGQAVWFGLNHVTWDLSIMPPVRIGRPSSLEPDLFGVPAWLGRVLMLGGLLGIGGLLAWLVFWYWRLLRISAEEAKMILLDLGWRESRRELNRQEKWRAWGRAKASRRGRPS